MSTEEISHEHLTIEAADSGRGSWTSCSSNSHDNFQNIQNQKGWDLLNSYRHAHLERAIAEVEPSSCCPEETHLQSHSHSDGSRQPKTGMDFDQSRHSWASSTSLSDMHETNYGTIKRRGLESLTAEQAEVLDAKTGSDAAYKTVTSSTEHGLIGKRDEKPVDVSTAVVYYVVELLRNGFNSPHGQFACKKFLYTCLQSTQVLCWSVSRSPWGKGGI